MPEWLLSCIHLSSGISLLLLHVRGTSFSESFHWYKEGEAPTRKGKYSVLRTNTKPQQLIKHTEISYSTATLVFRKFLCGTYRNGLNRGTSKLMHSKSLKTYELCQFDTFCRESAISYTRAQGAVPQKCICVSKITGHHFPG